MYYVYLMTNKAKTVIYTGVTNNLERRVYEHKSLTNKSSFTFRYKLTNLVYFESFHESVDEIAREKQIKNGSREKKINLIEVDNPKWDDLSVDWFS